MSPPRGVPKDEERAVRATVLRKDLAKQLDKEFLRDGPECDEPIVVDAEGDILSGDVAAAAACRAETRGNAEIEVLMVLDPELALRLEAAEVERDECLEEVLDEAERSD